MRHATADAREVERSDRGTSSPLPHMPPALNNLPLGSKKTMNTQMTLGELTIALQHSEMEDQVRFDFGLQVPTQFNSYRGFYEDLALGYTEEKSIYESRVKEVLAACVAAIDSIYVGYKGGDYRMTRQSRIWVAKCGDASGIALVGVRHYHGDVVLETRFVGYERI